MAESVGAVEFDRSITRVRRRQVRELARHLSVDVAGGESFSCRIAPVEEIRELNRDYRGKDAPTDVLSFPAGEVARRSAAFLGDVAISIRHAREQARTLGHTVEEEIGILMLHGVLHLMGMDHETDRGQMRRAEARWRKRLGLPPGLTERTR
jgi:probable rRNA maturation factor